MALLALYTMRTERIALDQGLGVAASIYASERAATSAYLKKCKSEARAMLLDVSAADLAGSNDTSPSEFFRTAERLLVETSLVGATRRRASRLQGAKGGRRAQGSMPLLRAVRELAGRARLGDPRAAAELQAIASYLALGEAAESPGEALPQD